MRVKLPRVPLKVKPTQPHKDLKRKSRAVRGHKFKIKEES